MTRPLLLDTFCGAGGCSVGYNRAGFDVIGIDTSMTTPSSSSRSGLLFSPGAAPS